MQNSAQVRRRWNAQRWFLAGAVWLGLAALACNGGVEENAKAEERARAEERAKAEAARFRPPEFRVETIVKQDDYHDVVLLLRNAADAPPLEYRTQFELVLVDVWSQEGGAWVPQVRECGNGIAHATLKPGAELRIPFALYGNGPHRLELEVREAGAEFWQSTMVETVE